MKANHKRPMRNLVIGLTGGIGAGKSLALAEFARCGAAAIASDEIAREQARPGGPAFPRIVRAFGRGVLDPGGAIDRRELAARAFLTPARRRRLERLTHPHILREMRRRLARARGVAVVDVPLLFEKGVEGRFDATLLIDAKPRTRLLRVMRREGLSRAEVRRRMSAQLPDSAKRRRADVVLPNEGSREALRARVREYYGAFVLLSQYSV